MVFFSRPAIEIFQAAALLDSSNWLFVRFCSFLFLGSSPLNILFPSYAGRPFTMAQRLLTQPRVVLHYISLLFYPAPGRLNLDYDFPLSYSLFSPVDTFVAILLIIGLLGLAVFTAKKYRLHSFCILWFLGNLVIESSTIPLEIIFEHRTYLPSMLVILLLVLFLYQAVQKKRVLIVFLVSISLLFSYWTYARNKVWKDELSLWADIYKKSPDKARVNQHFGKSLFNANRVDEAIPILEKALQLYEEEIKLQKSVDSYKTSFHLINLGLAYKKKGLYKKAISVFNRALEAFYFSSKAHYHLGLCYSSTWQLEKAVFHFSKALEFAEHHRSDIDMQSGVAIIKNSLAVAQRSLKEKEKRELLKKENINK